MPLLCSLYMIGQRVRLNNPADPWHHGQVGTVRSIKGPLVPCQVRDGLPVPNEWSWFRYTIELDEGKTLQNTSELSLETISKGI